jgi:hypothetical protein
VLNALLVVPALRIGRWALPIAPRTPRQVVR